MFVVYNINEWILTNFFENLFENTLSNCIKVELSYSMSGNGYFPLHIQPSGERHSSFCPDHFSLQDILASNTFTEDRMSKPFSCFLKVACEPHREQSLNRLCQSRYRALFEARKSNRSGKIDMMEFVVNLSLGFVAPIKYWNSCSFSLLEDHSYQM